MDDDGRRTCYIRRDERRIRVDNVSPTQDEFLAPFEQIALVKKRKRIACVAGTC